MLPIFWLESADADLDRIMMGTASFESLEREGGAQWDPGAVRELNGKNASEPEVGASHW